MKGKGSYLVCKGVCKGLCTSVVKLKPRADPAAATCNLIFPGSFLLFAMWTVESSPAGCALLTLILLLPREQPPIWGTSTQLDIVQSKCSIFHLRGLHCLWSCRHQVHVANVAGYKGKKTKSESGAETREVGFEVFPASLDKVLDSLI